MLNKHKVSKFLIFLTAVFIFSCVSSFFYCYFTTRNEIIIYDNKISNVQSSLVVKLPRLDTYLVKLWGEKRPEKVYFNNIEIIPFRISSRNNTEEAYIKFDRALVNEGRNIISIVSQNSYSMRIKNFYGLDDSRKLFLLFDSSRFLRFNTGLFFDLIFLIFGVLIAAFCLLYYFTRLLFFNLDFFKLFLNFVLYNALCFAFIFILVLTFKVHHYRVIFLPLFFLKAAGIYICLSFLFSFLGFLFKYRHKINLNSKARLLLCKVIRFPTSERKDLSFFLECITLKIKTCPGEFLIRLAVSGFILCYFFIWLKLYFLSEIISYFIYFSILAGLIVKFNKLKKGNYLE